MTLSRQRRQIAVNDNPIEAVIDEDQELAEQLGEDVHRFAPRNGRSKPDRAKLCATGLGFDSPTRFATSSDGPPLMTDASSPSTSSSCSRPKQAMLGSSTPPITSPPAAASAACLVPGRTGGAGSGQGLAVQVRLDAMELHRPRQWGACWLACDLYEQLQLDRFFAPLLPSSREGTNWQHIVQTLVCYRLIDPGSEWRLHRQWFEQSAMADLLGEDYGLVAKNGDEAAVFRRPDRRIGVVEALFAELSAVMPEAARAGRSGSPRLTLDGRPARAPKHARAGERRAFRPSQELRQRPEICEPPSPRPERRRHDPAASMVSLAARSLRECVAGTDIAALESGSQPFSA